MGGELTTTPSIAHGDGDRAFGRGLTDDVTVELFSYFAGTHGDGVKPSWLFGGGSGGC